MSDDAPSNLDVQDAARDRRFWREQALTAAVQVAAPGSPADRVLGAAAAFYDYLTTDVLPVVEEPE